MGVKDAAGARTGPASSDMQKSRAAARLDFILRRSLLRILKLFPFVGNMRRNHVALQRAVRPPHQRERRYGP